MNPGCESISSILGTSNLLKIVFNSEKFLEWLNENHPNLDKKEIFPGYRFFLESAIGSFALSITFDKALEINEDYVYFRADFYGADLNKFPVTCEKTAILKNIQKRQKLIKQANNFDQLKIKTEIFSNEILSPFFLILHEHCSVNSNLAFEDSLKYSTMRVTLIELTDFSKWIPQGYLLSPLRIRGDPQRFESHKDKFKDEFLGYKLTLQYLWSCLLGETFGESGLVDLHQATDWTRNFSPEEVFGHRSTEGIDRTDLDRYFSIINNEILGPLEEKWECVRQNKIFCLKESYSKKILGPLLSYNENLSLTPEEKLRYTLLWYDIELLDSSQNEIFNGVPAFCTLLSGAAELKSKYANGEKAIICKFSHPGGTDKNEYSYGVLVETGGDTGFTDYSGWILCYDCCNDFTGFAGSGHLMAEKLIEEYSAKNLIYLRPMDIDKKVFEKYLAENTTTGKKKDLIAMKSELALTRKKNNENFSEVKGLLHEFLTYYTIINRGTGSIDWNVMRNGDQLDITWENEDTYRLIECKVNSNNMNLKNEIEKIYRKLFSTKTTKQKIGQFWFYYPPSPDFHEAFKKIQKAFSKNNIFIDDYEVLSKIIQEEKLWKSKKLDKIQNIFDPKPIESQTSPQSTSRFNISSHVSSLKLQFKMIFGKIFK